MDNKVKDCSREIEQMINELTIQLGHCKPPTNSELTSMLNILKLMNQCNGGGDYNVLVQETHTAHKEVSYPIGTFHSFSINVLEGSMIYGGVMFPAGTTRNVEFSTTNQTVVKFMVNQKSKVFIEYLKS